MRKNFFQIMAQMKLHLFDYNENCDKLDHSRANHHCEIAQETPSRSTAKLGVRQIQKK